MLFILKIESRINAFLLKLKVFITCIIVAADADGIQPVPIHQFYPVDNFRIFNIVPADDHTSELEKRLVRALARARGEQEY